MSEQGVYLFLFHGRKTIGEHMEDWGEEGPMIGPLNIAWTYGNIKILTEDWDDFEFLPVVEAEGLVYYKDMYYGDFEIQIDPKAPVTETAEEFINNIREWKKISDLRSGRLSELISSRERK